MRTLVVGCDASGKSSFIESVHSTWADSYGESTQSEEARNFRKINHNRVIDAEYIEQRESLYLKLSQQALVATKQSTVNIVTSDSSLVTRTSHSVMRQIIGEPYLTNEQVIASWKNDEAQVEINAPEIIVLTYAPFSTIKSRILARQKAGDILENFQGFNALPFLEAYQERWKKILESLAQQSYNCIAFDTTTTSIEEELETYATIRERVLTN